MPHSVAQRVVTMAEFDHVALVGPNPDPANAAPCMMEACGFGVALCLLDQRVSEYKAKFAERICWRQLSPELSPEQTAELRRFANGSRDASYSFNLHKILFTLRTATPLTDLVRSARNLLGEPSQPAAPRSRSRGRSRSRSREVPEKAYFCSQLVAHLLKAAGCVQRVAAPASFWPADFGGGGAIETWLARGFSLSPERDVIWPGRWEPPPKPGSSTCRLACPSWRRWVGASCRRWRRGTSGQGGEGRERLSFGPAPEPVAGGAAVDSSGTSWCGRAKRLWSWREHAPRAPPELRSGGPTLGEAGRSARGQQQVVVKV